MSESAEERTWPEIIAAMDEPTVRREFLAMCLRSETPSMIADLESALATALKRAEVAEAALAEAIHDRDADYSNWQQAESRLRDGK